MFWKRERTTTIQLVSPSGSEATSILHRMFRFNWNAWRNHPLEARRRTLEEVADFIQPQASSIPSLNEQSALYSLVGHDDDLMMVNFHDSVEDFNESRVRFAQTEFFSYLIPTNSYLSMEELSQRELLATLHGRVPSRKYLCFYTMTGLPLTRTGLYYTPTITDHRERMMHALERMAQQHVAEIQQIVSGSIGLDGWEWAVDMFGDDPIIFKKVIYDLRFHESHAIAATSAGASLGLRLDIHELES